MNSVITFLLPMTVMIAVAIVGCFGAAYWSFQKYLKQSRGDVFDSSDAKKLSLFIRVLSIGFGGCFLFMLAPAVLSFVFN